MCVTNINENNYFNNPNFAESSPFIRTSIFSPKTIITQNCQKKVSLKRPYLLNGG